MPECRVCNKDNINVLIDCGSQPLCNRFVVDPKAKEYRHPLVMGQCESCGLIQLIQPVPAEEITPRFEWLKYNEPEGHLDHLADVICSLPGIARNPVACGVTYKDDTLLKRLENRKFQTLRIHPEKDLNIGISGAGGETVLPKLTPETAAKLTEKNGRTDVVIARHAYEHAPESREFLDALKKLVKPGGYVVFEVPDCTLQLKSTDYGMIWEEHILYFTQETYRNSFGFSDYALIRYECYSYPVENALVAITKPVEQNEPISLKPEMLKRELDLGNYYGKGLRPFAERLQRYLEKYREEKGRVAIFGAGHLACMYINLLGIGDFIEFVVDDNPNKKGLFMPGSLLPIYDSNYLVKKNIRLCLLSLSPESEEKVIGKNGDFVKQGGSFASIFPSSANWLKI